MNESMPNIEARLVEYTNAHGTLVQQQRFYEINEIDGRTKSRQIKGADVSNLIIESTDLQTEDVSDALSRVVKKSEQIKPEFMTNLQRKAAEVAGKAAVANSVEIVEVPEANPETTSEATESPVSRAPETEDRSDAAANEPRVGFFERHRRFGRVSKYVGRAALIVGLGLGAYAGLASRTSGESASAQTTSEPEDKNKATTTTTANTSSSSSSTTTSPETTTTTNPNTAPTDALNAEQLAKADANVLERAPGAKLTKITDLNAPLTDEQEMGVYSFNGGDKKNYERTAMGGLKQGADILSATNGFTADQARVMLEAFKAKGAPDFMIEQIKKGEYKPSVSVTAWKIETAATYVNINDNVNNKLSVDPRREVKPNDVFFSFTSVLKDGTVLTIVARNDCGLQPFDKIIVPAPAAPQAPKAPKTPDTPRTPEPTTPRRVTTTTTRPRQTTTTTRPTPSTTTPPRTTPKTAKPPVTVIGTPPTTVEKPKGPNTTETTRRTPTTQSPNTTVKIG